MSRRAHEPALHDICDAILDLRNEAQRFVAPSRMMDIVTKWAPGVKAGQAREYEQICGALDAAILSADLALSIPSASGSTAFDRLAKSLRDPPPAQKAAALALLHSRFRLLAVTEIAPPSAKLEDVFVCGDVLSGEKLLLAASGLPTSALGLTLFGRAVRVVDGVWAMPGAITPLDYAALQIAEGHPAAKTASGNARWADAIYRHVVRHGTLLIPGINRPADTQSDLFADAVPAHDDPIHATMHAWLAIGDNPPDAELLRHTRALAELQHILIVIGDSAMMRHRGEIAKAAALEQIARVFLETIMRRERSGSGALTMDMIRQSIEREISHGMPSDSLPLFSRLRDSLLAAGGMPVRDDLALARLMARIQGLRAKTTEQGCTEHEALAAAEKVAELLDRHGLSLGELEFRAQPCEGIGIDTSRRRFAPIDSCVPGIAAFFDCRVWTERAEGAPLRYVFFGLRADVAAAQYLYELVDRAFETETNAFRAGDLYARLAGERRRATNSFQTGMATGINQKLAALRAARDVHCRSLSGRDLVQVKASMVDDEVEKLGLSLTRRAISAGGKTVLRDAFHAGKEAGQRFEYAPAIGAAA
jgi:hypothetical protein